MTTFEEGITEKLDKLVFGNDYPTKIAANDIIQMFDKALTDLVVEERVNYRGICTKTIRKIRERILYPQTDSPGEKISPEPKDHS